MNRRLYRCRHDRRLAGVAAGMAEYFDLDPTLVRVLWFASIFFGGFGILVYLALAIIVPLEPVAPGEAVDGSELAHAGTFEPHRHVHHGTGRVTTFAGIVLILIGGFALLEELLPSWIDAGRYLWPGFLVAVGAVLVVGALRREDGRPATSNEEATGT